MRAFFSILSLLFFLNDSQGQTPYQLSWKTEGIILSASGVLGAVDYSANQRLTLLTTEEIYTAVDFQEVNRFDKIACSLYSERADIRSNLGMYLVSGAALYAGWKAPAKTKEKPERLAQTVILGVLCLETNIVNGLATDLIKSTVQRTRPYVYNPDFPIEKKYGYNSRKSFLSGHTSYTAANAFFAAKVFSDYYPNSQWKPLVWSAAALIPAWTAAERVLAGKHFPSDVIAGYIFGAACGYFIPHLHTKEVRGSLWDTTISPFSNRNGNGIQMIVAF